MCSSLDMYPTLRVSRRHACHVTNDMISPVDAGAGMVSCACVHVCDSAASLSLSISLSIDSQHGLASLAFLSTRPFRSLAGSGVLRLEALPYTAGTTCAHLFCGCDEAVVLGSGYRNFLRRLTAMLHSPPSARARDLSWSWSAVSFS